MSRNSRRTDSVTESHVPVGVTAVDIEDIVGKAVSAATAVIRDEFTKLISDIQARLQSIEDRLSVAESTGTTSSLQKDAERLERSIEAMQQEMRQHAAAANDAAQYLRRNNIRIKGLPVKDSEDCRRTVTEFIRKELHEHVTEDDIEVAHTLPIPTPARTAQSATRGQVTTPVVIVRFCRRDVRDRIIVKRKVLKSTKIAIVEDLTSLNMEVLNRLRNNDSVQKTWSWNGHIRALLKNGKKIQVRPFESIEDCLAK